jgi:heavy metal efflux system protein
VRLRTVLMTALLAMLGLLPMALSTAIGSETQRPLALVVIGGLLSATALTLIVLPVLYLMFEQRYERRASRIATPLQRPADQGSA